MREGGGCAVSDRRMLRAAGHPAVPSLRRSREMAGTYLGDGGGFGPDGNSSGEECAKDSARVHLARHVLLPCQTGSRASVRGVERRVSGPRKPLSSACLGLFFRSGPRVRDQGKRSTLYSPTFRRREAHDERASSTKTSSVASPRSPLGTHAHAQQTCSRLSPRVLPPPRHRRRDLRGRRSARPFAGSRSRRVAGRRSRRRRRRPVPASRYRMASGSAPPG